MTHQSVETFKPALMGLNNAKQLENCKDAFKGNPRTLEQAAQRMSELKALAVPDEIMIPSRYPLMGDDGNAT